MLGTLPLLAAPVVLLRDLGPLPGTSLRHTVWSPGRRLLVHGTNQPITPADFNAPGSMITIVPDGYQDNQDELAKAAVILIKFRPGELQIPTRHAGGTLVGTMNWTVDNIVAYSKICTHVGCPVALYEQTTHHILCPCHQSTFDAANGAEGDLRPGRAAAAPAADDHGLAGVPGGQERLHRARRPEFLGARMSDTDFDVPKALSGTGGWLDDRFHGARGFRVLMRKVFPDHWSFMLGEIALWSFVILLLTGTFLSLFFMPSMTEVTYHGSYVKLNGIRMSEAYESTLRISFDVRGGLLIRQIHHWAAVLFMAALIMHMLRVFFTGAYRKPREVNWLIGIGLFTLGLLEGLFGYSLPDDQLSGAGLRIFEGVLQGIPIVGTYLAYFLFGGPFPGHDIVPRMYIIHVLLIPGILLALITRPPVHHVPPEAHADAGQGEHREERRSASRSTRTSWPRAAPGSSSSSARWCCWPRSPRSTRSGCTGPYSPVAISSASQPDFYMGILEGSLRIMPAWEINFLGHTLTLSVLIPFALPLDRSCWAGPRCGRSSSSGRPATSRSTTSTTGPGTRRRGPRPGWPR